ncbi:MAG: phosphoadenosine phosphosulfate reductase family protein [Kiritimatiellae bacterium]|nr:phosphoadenosine phosphosulfate reductase family protein [Kiritimatiellia bacterium]
MADIAAIEKKVEESKKVILEAFEKYTLDDMKIAFTGGKDSMLLLWLVHEAIKDNDNKMPKCFSIDEGDMFKEVSDFMEECKEPYGIEIEMIHNTDVSSHANGLGSEVAVADLNERNKREVTRLGYEEDTFTYEPESYVGNHLMKTVTCMVYVEDNNVKAFFEGIRWDEQGARAEETYFSPRPATEFNPEHVRINPILHFTERDVWDTLIHYKVPTCVLYKEGYRSLGAKITTKKISDLPAWEQDLENTTERGGRRQDKEGLMGRLRKLGYM